MAVVAITGDYVTDAVAGQLKTAYPAMKRYVEKQEEEIARPCFFIQQILLSQDKQMSRKYTRLYRIRIVWLPLSTSSTPRTDCQNMGEALLGLFRLLTLPWKNCFGRNAEFEVIENELIFTIEFPIFADWVEDPGPDMQTLEVNEDIKD